MTEAIPSDDVVPRGTRLPRLSRIIAGLIAIGAVCALASLCWDLLADFRLQQQAHEVARLASFELGAWPSCTEAEDWLRRNGYENIDRKFGRQKFGERNGSFVVVCGEKLVSKAASGEESKYLVLWFGWDQDHHGFFSGVKSEIRVGAGDHPRPPTKMPHAVP